MLPCVILCGGLATRLRPVTEKIPKSLITIDGSPFITHQLRLLRSRGIKSVILCVGHLGEMIEAVAGDGSEFDLLVSYSYDGERLLGTGGAIRNALALLETSFFVLYGDSYLPCDYSAVAEAFDSSRLPGLMTIYNNHGKYDSSNVEAANGRIIRYDKRNKSGKMHYIDYGLGVFLRSVFETMPANEFHDLSEVYQRLLADGQLASFEIPERFYEIGSPEGIADCETFLAQSRFSTGS